MVYPHFEPVKPEPKPKFWLWDFRSRKVCDLAYLYGAAFGMALGLTIGSKDASAWFNAIAIGFLVIGKFIHTKLPLAGKDNQ